MNYRFALTNTVEAIVSDCMVKQRVVAYKCFRENVYV